MDALLNYFMYYYSAKQVRRNKIRELNPGVYLLLQFIISCSLQCISWRPHLLSTGCGNVLKCVTVKTNWKFNHNRYIFPNTIKYRHKLSCVVICYLRNGEFNLPTSSTITILLCLSRVHFSNRYPRSLRANSYIHTYTCRTIP